MSLETLEDTLKMNAAREFSEDCKSLIAKIIARFGGELCEIIEGKGADESSIPSSPASNVVVLVQRQDHQLQ